MHVVYKTKSRGKVLAVDGTRSAQNHCTVIFQSHMDTSSESEVLDLTDRHTVSVDPTVQPENEDQEDDVPEEVGVMGSAVHGYGEEVGDMRIGSDGNGEYRSPLSRDSSRRRGWMSSREATSESATAPSTTSTVRSASSTGTARRNQT